MAITKRLNIKNIFVFLFLVLFPFGQIIKIGILQPLDLIVGLGAIYSLVSRQPRPSFVKYLNDFVIIATFSWVVSTLFLNDTRALYGLLYLMRLTGYIYFSVYVWNFSNKTENRNLLVSSLLSVSIISAVLGWLQFFVFPDIKPLFVLGWDMHLFRLVGAFLDPGYLGIIVVFGLLISIIKLIDKKEKKFLLISLFLFISLAFTYSRASYLAFLTGLIAIAVHKKAIKQVLFFALGLIFLVLILPTSRNHSIELFRSFSAIARIDNYKETLVVAGKLPIFGVGYDNMCLAYNKYVGFKDFSSHACSGSDSSFLFVFATTGIIGLMIFIYNLVKIKELLHKTPYKIYLISAFWALSIHSFFANSVFYPWVMGYMIILLSLAI